MKDDIQKIIAANKRQQEFYNSTQKAKKSWPTKLWYKIRNKLLDPFRGEFQLKARVYEEHKDWLGDISNKKILDLGCLRGNALSLYMAKNSKQYVGIDLSEVAIADLKNKLQKNDCSNAKALAVDFLSPDFKEADFDIIYAYGVLHHFENFEILIAKLNEKLGKNGVVISYDPLETSFPIKVLRKMYRPFQSDKDWEWPFGRKTIKKIDNNFRIEKIRGILGKSKYGVFINLLPLNKSYKEKVIRNLIEKDWNISEIRDIYSCMHVSMLFRKI